MNEKTGSISRLKWVYISGAAFLLFSLFSILLISFAERLSSFGITKSFYYILLIPVGLCAAGFLFGAMHSHARYVGKNSYGQLELTGPVVIFCLVVIGGFYFAKPEDTFLLTVRVNTPDENMNKISGTVIADFGTERTKKSLNENGEVIFTEIPSKFLGREINISTDIPGYISVNKEPLEIPESKVISIELKKREYATLVRGMVIDREGNPLSDVTIDLESGLASSKSDIDGKFQMTVPEKSGTSLLLVAIKNGKTGFRDYVTLPERSSLIIKFEN